MKRLAQNYHNCTSSNVLKIAFSERNDIEHYNLKVQETTNTIARFPDTFFPVFGFPMWYNGKFVLSETKSLKVTN